MKVNKKGFNIYWYKLSEKFVNLNKRNIVYNNNNNNNNNNKDHLEYDYDRVVCLYDEPKENPICF
jgi:hypothetical protein